LQDGLDGDSEIALPEAVVDKLTGLDPVVDAFDSYRERLRGFLGL
jgi:hypothetical protein